MPDVRERDHAMLVTCYMRTGQSKEALAVCEELVKLSPNSRYRDLCEQLRTLS